MSYDYRDFDTIPVTSVDIKSGNKSTATVTVTPLDAKSLLENNSRNRAINQNTVLRYAMMMERGEWDWCDGDSTLKFGKGGVLRNGQHRLTAQMLANVTGAYDIRTGVPEESYKNMDRNVRRNVSSYFYGREYPNDVSALANRIMYAQYGYVEPHASMRAIGEAGIPTDKRIIEFAEEHYDELVECIKKARRVKDQNKKGAPASYGCALWMLGIPDEEKELFVRAYVDGDDYTSLTKQTLLKKLVDRTFKPRPHWFGGVLLMAYDAWTQGRGIKVLRMENVLSRYKSEVAKFSARSGGDAN